MWQLSPAATKVIRRTHQVDYRVTAFTITQGQLPLASLTGGSVTCDSKSQVRRKGTVELAAPNLFPDLPEAALSPLGGELRVEYGIVIPRVGVEWVPLIHGPIQEASATLVRAAPGSAKRVSGLSVPVSDRAQSVADDRLTAPMQTISGALAVAEIARIVSQTLPLVEVVDLTGGNTVVAPSLTVEKDRWQDGVEKLADAAGVEAYFDQLGRFVIRPTPTLDDPAVWRIDAGEGGVLIKADLKRTRDQVYNGVAVSGESTSGSTPVTALVTDDDPASPTRWGGPFGKKVRYYTSPLIVTVDQAQAVGRTMLERVRGYATTVNITAIPNPALEGGDVIEVDLGDGLIQRHIIDQVPVSLTPGEQALTTRSIELPAEQ